MSASTAGTVALAAAAAALLALAVALVLVVQVRRLRAAQSVLIGDRGPEDLVAHAALVQHGFEALRDWVQVEAERLDARMADAEVRLDESFTRRGLVRYDAYAEMGGHQSSSLALLDALGSGMVLSTIVHRDSARFYCKQVLEGRGETELSPEEAEAVRVALSGERGTRTIE